MTPNQPQIKLMITEDMMFIAPLWAFGTLGCNMFCNALDITKRY
jgi:hypothetical protein